MEISKCKRCGNEIKSIQKKCPNCGKTITEFSKIENTTENIKTKQCFMCGNEFDIQLKKCPKCNAETNSSDYSQPKNKNMQKYIYNGETYESNGWFRAGAPLLLMGGLFTLISLFSEINTIWVGLCLMGIAGILYAVGYYKKQQGEINSRNSDEDLDNYNDNIEDEETNNLMNEISKNQSSPNFQFTAKVLKSVVFSELFDFNKYFNHPRILANFLDNILDEMNKIINVEDLYDIYIDFDENENRKAIILQVPMINYTECESNFIGITLDKTNNQIKYLSSEYYKDSEKYFLCSCTKDMRMFYEIEIKNKEDFISKI